ncbi:universal stress protein [Mycolicibacterium monacense DSM 44395]|nr:universal stress protein [Mycolicibacterium monacense DSM 44395]ORB20809.1 universal stress protein [Mycolicibacterium monacense DSM 44395]QHP84940.1 universal stress protein [Mycolicibacterium monacense DSM 44395]
MAGGSNDSVGGAVRPIASSIAPTRIGDPMDTTELARPVVVGVDGSQAALDAVRWAVDEAVGRSVPLRLVHATGVTPRVDQSDDEFRLEREYAETALRAASAAAQSAGREVKLETEILWGSPDSELVTESHGASMVCVGSVGIGAIANVLLGSTAVTVSMQAQCCVAVLRRGARPAPNGSVAVATDGTPDSDGVVIGALDEARLRGCPVVVVGVRRWESHAPSYDELDRRTAQLADRYPDVRTKVVATDGGIVRYLTHQRDDDIEMVVVGSADADAVADMVGPHDTLFGRDKGHSVLVVR